LAYRIEIKRSARKELGKLPKPAQRQVARQLDKLTEDPRHSQTEEIVGGDGAFRVRAGDYRIVYHVLDDAVVVFVIAIRHRGEVYRKR